MVIIVVPEELHHRFILLHMLQNMEVKAVEIIVIFKDGGSFMEQAILIRRIPKKERGMTINWLAKLRIKYFQQMLGIKK